MPQRHGRREQRRERQDEQEPVRHLAVLRAAEEAHLGCNRPGGRQVKGVGWRLTGRAHLGCNRPGGRQAVGL
eukprot:24729-Chlamydomonas_euryale.AAC.2